MRKLIPFIFALLITLPCNAQQIPDLDAIDVVADGDLFYCVDVSDTTDSANGTGKKCTSSQIASNVDTDTNTNANTECSGTTTYYDGEGNCDDISGVYVQASDWTTIDNYPSSCTGNNFVQGLGDTLTCAQPDDVTGNAATATALVANGSNCSSGSAPLGVDASGAVESCFDVWTEAENTSAAYIANVSEDTTPQLGGALDGQGNDLNNLGVVFMTEQAEAEVDVAGKGQWWVDNLTPNIPMFTDDAGNDRVLLYSGGALGTPASGNGSNLTALNATQLTSGTVPAARVGAGHIDTITEIASGLKDGTGACSSGLLCLGGHTHAISSEVSGLGTGVATALAINVGSGGAPVTFNGAGGTPSSIILTNASGYPSASATASGISELATAAETTTGTDTGRTVTPDGLAGSDFGKRLISVLIFGSSTAVTTGDGTSGVPITSELNGYNIVDVQCNVHEKGITGATDVQLRRQRGATDVDVLSTKITIGDEYYASDEVINASNDDLATGDQLFFDVDAIHSGTAPNGLSCVVVAQLP